MTCIPCYDLTTEHGCVDIDMGEGPDTMDM